MKNLTFVVICAFVTSCAEGRYVVNSGELELFVSAKTTWRVISDKIIDLTSKHPIRKVSITTGGKRIEFDVPESRDRQPTEIGQVPWDIGIPGMEGFYGGYSVYTVAEHDLLYFIIRAENHQLFGPSGEELGSIDEFIPTKGYGTIVANIIFQPDMEFQDVAQIISDARRSRATHFYFSCGISPVVWPPMELVYKNLPMENK